MRKWILLALVCLVTSVSAEAQTNYGRIRTDGISNKQTMPGRGTPFAKNTGGIMYVSVSGNDANDGLSWSSAKLTINAAICALPYGNCASSPRQAGAGTVIYQEGVAVDATSNVGIWLAGTGDSQYASLPAGWMKAYAFGGLSVRCGTRATGPAHQHQPACAVGTFTPGTNKPLIWTSGTTQPLYFADFSTASGTAVAWIGRDSTGCMPASGVGACTGSVAQSISVTLDNLSWGPTSIQTGQTDPALMIGNGYWIHVRDSSFNGNPAFGSVVSSASRSSNVVTYTTSATCNFTAGQTLSIMQLPDSTFNGTRTAASGCSGGSTFTVNQTGPNASTSGAGAAAFADAGFSMVLFGPQLEMRNPHEENGGGIKFYNTGSNGTMRLDDVYMEGTSPTTPQVWMFGGNADISNLTAADATSIPSVYNEGGGLVVVRSSIPVSQPVIAGPGITINGYNQAASTSTFGSL